MALTKNQIDAIDLLFDDRLTVAQVAEHLGISERTLRRWKDLPEFIAVMDYARKELFKKNRKHMLATAQGRLDSLLAMHRELVDRKHIVLSTSAVLNLVHHKIYVSLVREIIHIEREIARTLGQYNPSKPEVLEEVEEREEDISCLTKKEGVMFEYLNRKVMEANPWKEQMEYKLTDWEKAECLRLVEEHWVTRETPDIKYAPDIIGQPDGELFS